MYLLQRLSCCNNVLTLRNYIQRGGTLDSNFPLRHPKLSEDICPNNVSESYCTPYLMQLKVVHVDTKNRPCSEDFDVVVLRLLNEGSLNTNTTLREKSSLKSPMNTSLKLRHSVGNHATYVVVVMMSLQKLVLVLYPIHY